MISSANYAFATPSLNLTENAGQTTKPFTIFDSNGNALFSISSSGTVTFKNAGAGSNPQILASSSVAKLTINNDIGIATGNGNFIAIDQGQFYFFDGGTNLELGYLSNATGKQISAIVNGAHVLNLTSTGVILQAQLVQKNQADHTKIFKTDTSAIATGHTVTLTIPNNNGTIALTNGIATISANNVFTGTTNSFNPTVTFNNDTIDLTHTTNTVDENKSPNPRYANILSTEHYYSNSTTNPYELTMKGIESNIDYGQLTKNATGTVQAFTAQDIVTGDASHNAGYDEHGMYTYFSTFDNNSTGNFWGTDFNFQSSRIQMGLINGISTFVNNYYNGQPALSNSSGISIETRPHSGGELDNQHINKTTYPIDAGIKIAGTSGCVASQGGCTPTTTTGYRNGIDIGGSGGAWQVGTSVIENGIRINNVTKNGILLLKPNRGSTPTGISFQNGTSNSNWGIGIDMSSQNMFTAGTALSLGTNNINTVGSITIKNTGTGSNPVISSVSSIQKITVTGGLSVNGVNSFFVNSGGSYFFDGGTNNLMTYATTSGIKIQSGGSTMITFNGTNKIATLASGIKLIGTPTASTASVNFGTTSAYSTSPRQGDVSISGTTIKFNDNSNNTQTVQNEFNTNQTNGGNRTGLASATPVMHGLNTLIKTKDQGKINVQIMGYAVTSTTSTGCRLTVQYGTGNPPTAGGALTGTNPFNILKADTAVAGDEIPFNLSGWITGLSTNTKYWVDIGESNVSGATGTCDVDNPSLSLSGY